MGRALSAVGLWLLLVSKSANAVVPNTAQQQAEAHGKVRLLSPAHGTVVYDKAVLVELSADAVDLQLDLCLSSNEKTVKVQEDFLDDGVDAYELCFPYLGAFIFDVTVVGTLSLSFALYPSGASPSSSPPALSFLSVVQVMPPHFVRPPPDLRSVSAELDAAARRDVERVATLVSSSSSSSAAAAAKVVIFFLSFESHSQNGIFLNVARGLPRSLFSVEAVGFLSAQQDDGSSSTQDPLLPLLLHAGVPVAAIAPPLGLFSRPSSISQEVRSANFLFDLSAKTSLYLSPLSSSLLTADVLLVANSQSDPRLLLLLDVCRLVENSRGAKVLRVMDLPNVQVDKRVDVDAFVAPSHFSKEDRRRGQDRGGERRKEIKVVYPAAIEEPIKAADEPGGWTTCCEEDSLNTHSNQQQFPEEGPQKRVFRVGYLGRLALERHPALFLLMARQVVSEVLSRGQSSQGAVVPDVRFVVAGDGVLMAGLKALAKELGLDGHIDFVGAVAKEDVATFLTSLSVIVNPAIVETFGISNVEASFNLVPVVAFDGGGNSESVLFDAAADGGYGNVNILVDPKEGFGGLANAVLAVMRRPEHEERLRYCCNSKAAAVRSSIADRFGMKRFVNGYATFFAKLLEERGSKTECDFAHCQS